jgi:hypothetical protein
MAKLLNDTIDENYLKVLTYGRSGTGKTTLGVTAPQPLILLSERQGYRAVKDAAKRLGVPVPPTIWIETLEDLRVAVSTLQSDLEHPIPTIMRRLLGEGAASAIESLPYARPRTVVFDSMSDIFRLISEDIERTAGRKLGKDGLEAKPERYWGVLRDRGEKLIRATRDLPYHVLYLALLDDRTIGEGEEQSRVVGPECPMRALPTALVAATNMTGIASIKERAVKDEAGKVTYEYQHFVRFAGPSWMATKPLRPLGDVEPPHFGAWLERVADADGKAAPPLDLGGYEPAADEGLNQGAAVAADATPSSDRADNGTEQAPRARTARRRTTNTTNDDAAG